MKQWDKRLTYKGRQYASIYGFADAIAKDRGIDQVAAEEAALAVECECDDCEECPSTRYRVNMNDVHEAIAIVKAQHEEASDDSEELWEVYPHDVDAAIAIVKARHFRTVNAKDCQGCKNYSADNSCRANSDPFDCGMSAQDQRPPKGFASQRRKGAVNAGDCLGCPYFDDVQVTCKANKEPSTCGYAGLHGYGSGIV